MKHVDRTKALGRAIYLLSILALIGALFLRTEAQAQQQQAAAMPWMVIKIYNDDPKNYIFPVYTTGQHRPPEGHDIWLQAFFKKTLSEIRAGANYYTNLGYRFYLTNATGDAPLGVAPKKSVAIWIPLYTQLAKAPDPKLFNQYADWWNGATIQLFYSPNAAPPKALTDLYKLRMEGGRWVQAPLVSQASEKVFPTCNGCGKLMFFSAASDVKPSFPSQLLEFTMGARVERCVRTPDPRQCKPWEVPDDLDLENVDFDISYVNIAFGPAAMGPFKNDQVGYVGSGQTIGDFDEAMRRFLAQTRQADGGWPQFLDGARHEILKVPSPLEIFTRLTGAHPPPDLSPLPDTSYNWPAPQSLWPPIRDLYSNWLEWAGSVENDRTPAKCVASAQKNEFCDAILAARALMVANYNRYKDIVAEGKCTTKKPVTLTNALMVGHVYGWTPFIEGGCPAGSNRLEKTPGYEAGGYKLYTQAKGLFDLLNYGKLPNSKYVFNPYVTFIHGDAFANIKNAYAYSVDDAVGNVQAEGKGIIIDYASVEHLENKLPAAPPIDINFGLKQDNVSYTHYAVCKLQNDDGSSRWKAVKPYFLSFIINANAPQSCPVYFKDDKSPNQWYTFTVVTAPAKFPERLTSDRQIWDAQTANPIACSGNPANPRPPYYPSSRQWCCDKSSSAGIFAFRAPDFADAHQSQKYNVQIHGPQASRDLVPTWDETCNRGMDWPP